MCGRAYHTYSEEELDLRYGWEKLKRNPLGFKPNYNLCPTQLAPVITAPDGTRQLSLFRFGLVPYWAQDVKSASKYSLINAKSEEIEEKRSYKQAFERRRCIVPVSGFFEWKRVEGGAKRPFAISLTNGGIMSLAGVWERWKSKESDEEVHSFSLLTTAANTFMERIHNRMPVILSEKDEEAWLDPDSSIEVIKKLLKPSPPTWLAATEVSTLVNSPKNNRPELLTPLK